MAEAQQYHLCDDCLGVFEDAALHLSPAPPEKISSRLFYTPYRMSVAANITSTTCALCALLFSSIPRLKQLDNPENEILWIESHKHPYNSNSVTVYIVSSHISYPGQLQIKDIWRGQVHVRTLNSSRTLSEEALDNIQYWMKSCASSHVQCQVAKGIKRLPLRLVDVMSTGYHRSKYTGGARAIQHEELAGVRVVPSKNLPLNTPYLTLSHRWGNPPVLLLSTTTTFLLRDDISPYLLRHSETAAFQHAIYVTRALGYRYLWIDALCIMQDDEDEKTAEIMQIDEIYANSALNIAASEGLIYEGLLFDRNLKSVNPCSATVKISDDQTMCLLAFPNACFPRDTSLDKRGWVFQERILSPRICHFTKHQVFWQCRSLEASEILPEGNTKAVGRSFRGGMDVTASMEELNEWWYEMIGRYSSTSLTFPNDRLLAISAIAKRFCLAIQQDPSNYLAGMWKSDLPLSLLWHEDPECYLLPRDQTDPEVDISDMELICAPTWSWASILSPSQFVFTKFLDANATLLDISITRISPNFFDGATLCQLFLQGPLCKCRRQVSGGTPWIYIGQQTKIREVNSSALRRNDNGVLFWDKSRKRVADFLSVSANSSSTTSVFFLLPISSDKFREEGYQKRGIILQRNDSRGTYVRMGAFMTAYFGRTYSELGTAFEEDFGIAYQGSELEAAFNGNLQTLGDEDYIALDSTGRYTIAIV